MPTKAAAVAAALRDDIAAGVLAPGARLVIDELASRFGVSIIPVREALKRLETEGLVVIRPHAGVAVAEARSEDAVELFALMEAIELAAVRLAAARPGADLAAVDAAVAALDAARAAGDATAWSEANVRFHLSIVDAAGMRLGRELAERVLAAWERLRRVRFGGAAEPDRARADREHRALAAALRARDLPRLERLTAAHNRAALRAQARAAH